MLTKAERDAWVKYLRDGDIEQGEGSLFKQVGDEEYYCCLGVYLRFVEGVPTEKLTRVGMPCDVFDNKNTGIQFQSKLNNYTFRGENMYRSNLEDDSIVDGARAFAYWNDECKYSFKRIANIIEALPTID